jgi:hypothetical protein
VKSQVNPYIRIVHSGAPALVATMRADLVLAKANAPTSQLRKELGVYLSHLHDDDSMLTVSTALSEFDEDVRTQLEACGDRPIGS